MENNLQNLTMSGFGKASGGKYNAVDISGAATIDGDIECESLHVTGGSKINGNVKTKTAIIAGGAAIIGNFEADTAKMDGVCSIKGNVSIKKADVKGSASITGNYLGEEIIVKGGLYVKGDSIIDNVKLDGYFNIGGALKSKTLDVRIEKGCKANDISGDSISLKSGTKTFDLINAVGSLFNKNVSVDVNTIEGNIINIENVNAKTVKGGKLIIGRQCIIDEAIYTEDIIVDSASKVTKQTKAV